MNKRKRRVWGLGFEWGGGKHEGPQGLGFGVWGSRFRSEHVGTQVIKFRFSAFGCGFRGWRGIGLGTYFGLRGVEGSGFRVWKGLGSRVEG